MIYYFTGPYTEKKSEIVSMMYDVLSTHRKNWRQKVFTFDKNVADTIHIYSVLHYLHLNDCDVVINLENTLNEVQPKWIIYIDVPDERKSVKTMFSNIITQLRVKNQI
jgi:hypothetical protein